MIRILNTANFSENNIGRIDIPRAYEPETISILDKFSFVPEIKKTAFDDFIVTLKSHNILSKLKYLMIPDFASNVEEALQNVLDGSKPLVSTGDATFNHGKLTLGTNKIDLTDSILPLSNVNECSYGIKIDNYKKPEANLTERILSLSSGNTAPRIFIETDNSMIARINTETESVDSHASNYVSISYSETLIAHGNGNSYKEKSGTTKTSFTYLQLNGNAPNNYNAYFTGNIRLLFFGDYLNYKQLQILDKAVNDLVK